MAVYVYELRFFQLIELFASHPIVHVIQFDMSTDRIIWRIPGF